MQTLIAAVEGSFAVVLPGELGAEQGPAWAPVGLISMQAPDAACAAGVPMTAEATSDDPAPSGAATNVTAAIFRTNELNM